MSYARARLWLGIISVGSLVILAILGLLLNVPESLLPQEQQPFQQELLGIFSIILVYNFILFPMDVLGGYAFPKEYHKHTQTFQTFITQWFRGAFTQSALFALILFSMLWIGRWGGTWLVWGWSLALMLGLLYAREALAYISSSLTPIDVDLPQTNDAFNIQVVEHQDPGFTGGWTTSMGKALLLIPHHWTQKLTATELSLQIQRRHYLFKNQSVQRASVFAIGWNLTGFGLALILPGSSVEHLAGLATTLLWFTLWSFLGVLTLPTFSRPAVYEADQHLQSNLSDIQPFESLLYKLDELQDGEQERDQAVENTFHPIPSVQNRLSHLQIPHSTYGLTTWNVARMSLFLSWACLGFLARAVHCNLGRPELWVFLPSD